DAPTYRFVRGDEKQPDRDHSIAPGLPRLLAPGSLDVRPVSLPPAAHSPQVRPFVLENYLRQAEAKITAARAARAQAKTTLAGAEKPAAQVAADPQKPAAAKVLFRDDFAGPRPELWEAGAGKWKHEKGKLLQEFAGAERSFLRTKEEPPADFEAKFKFV